MGQKTLVQITKEDGTNVLLPKNRQQVQVVRNDAAQQSGKYYAYFDDGSRELIGGPGAPVGLPFGNDNGVADAYQVTLVGATLTDGYTFEIRIANDNTGPATLQVNALGVKDLVDSDGNPLEANMVDDGDIYLIAYNISTDNYQLLGLAKPSPAPQSVSYESGSFNWDGGTGTEIVSTVKQAKFIWLYAAPVDGALRIGSTGQSDGTNNSCARTGDSLLAGTGVSLTKCIQIADGAGPNGYVGEIIVINPTDFHVDFIINGTGLSTNVRWFAITE